MEFPFTVVFEPPSRAELRASLRLRRVWVSGLLLALAVGTSFGLVHASRADAGASVAAAPLRITSQPAGASVALDGQQRGRTPLDLLVTPGAHAIAVAQHDLLEADYQLDVGAAGATLDAALWRRRPELLRLRPSLPGATLSSVQLLPDGELGLGVALPPGQQLQAWRLQPASGLLTAVATDLAGARLAIAPDASRVAYLGPEIGPDRNPATAAAPDTSARLVWVQAAARSAPTLGWRAPAGQQLVDLSWSPAADALLVVSRQPLAFGAVRDELWLVPLDGQPAWQLAALPSQVVAGSIAWSPDGQHLTFLAHAGSMNALCLVDRTGGFRYLADLDPSEANPLPYAPVDWAADSQQLLYVAPRQQLPTAPLVWPSSGPSATVYLARVDEPSPRPWAEASTALAAWRGDARLVSLARTGPDGALALSLLAADGHPQPLLELPLKPPGRYAATWAADRSGLLVAMASGAGSVDYAYVLLAETDDA